MAQRPRISLDWFYVTYRSVFAMAVTVVVALGGSVYFYRAHYAPSSSASKAIERAEREFGRASPHAGDEPQFEEMIRGARDALGEARSRFDDRRYDEAEAAALRSESLSLRVLASIKGDPASTSAGVRFYRIEGDVRVKRAGQFVWEPATKEMTLHEGDQVKTSSSASAQIIYFDGTVSTVRPGSLMGIKQLYENPVTKVRRVSQKLDWGEIQASTQEGNVEGSFHEVTTEKAAARSREEGEMLVALDRETKTASFDVFRGRVEVAGAGKRVMLEGGERVRATSDGKLRNRERLPDAPRLIVPEDERVFVHDDSSPASTRLAWEPVHGAKRYFLEIADGFLFTHPLYGDYREESSVAIEGIAEGSYYWRVSVVSKEGVRGPFSETRRFRVTSRKIRDTGDTTPPELEITDVVQTGAMLILNGRTEPGARVWIDNERVDVADDGSFYTVVRLKREGLNELAIKAQDAAGNRAALKRRAYVDAY